VLWNTWPASPQLVDFPQIILLTDLDCGLEWLNNQKAAENSVILKFKTAAARTAFLDRLKAEAPALEKYVKASFSQPTVVLVRGGLQENQFRPFLGSDVKVFQDARFEVLPQPTWHA
jgi:hypothetical protein